ncbi:MAG: hypothetical protein RIC95_05230 [Vicingaceae bacterium]
MTSLITLLISLLGYGSPADYTDYTEDQLNTEIAAAQADQDDNTDDGGGWGDWDQPGVTPEP